MHVIGFIDQSGICTAVEAPANVQDRNAALSYVRGLGYRPVDVSVGQTVDFEHPASRRTWLKALGLECFMLDHLKDANARAAVCTA